MPMITLDGCRTWPLSLQGGGSSFDARTPLRCP